VKESPYLRGFGKSEETTDGSKVRSQNDGETGNSKGIALKLPIKIGRRSSRKISKANEPSDKKTPSAVWQVERAKTKKGVACKSGGTGKKNG